MTNVYSVVHWNGSKTNLSGVPIKNNNLELDIDKWRLHTTINCLQKKVERNLKPKSFLRFKD